MDVFFGSNGSMLASGAHHAKTIHNYTIHLPPPKKVHSDIVRT